MKPWLDVFRRTFGRLFDVWSYSGSDEMAEKSAISAALRRRPHGPKIYVPRKGPKSFHDLNRGKTSILHNLFVRNSWNKAISAYQCGPIFFLSSAPS